MLLVHNSADGSFRIAATITASATTQQNILLESVQVYGGPQPADYKQLNEKFLRIQWVLTYLWFTTIWLVKACFLTFYFKLTHNLPPYRLAWYVIALYTFLVWVGGLAAWIPLRKSHGEASHAEIHYEFAVDISTELLSRLLHLRLGSAS